MQNLDASFNSVNISGDLNVVGENTIIDSSNIEIKNNRILFNPKNTSQDVGIDISYLDTSAHFLYNKNTNTWSTEHSSLKTNNIDLSGIINLYPQNSVNIGTINSLQNLDVSFNNLDISGILKGNIANNNTLSLGSHIIPTENAQYDLGSAEKKIRHLFLSDNSLWIGDNNKIDISNGEIQLKKRNIGKIPKIITDLSSDLSNITFDNLKSNFSNIIPINVYDISSIPIDKWLLIAKDISSTSNITIDDVFDTDPNKNIDLFAKIKDLEQKIYLLENPLTIGSDDTTNPDPISGGLTELQ